MKLKNTLREENDGVNAKGYFDSYKENIFGNEMDQMFQNMFENGSGSELHSKAEAIHSSSMLSYNFLHSIRTNPLSFGGARYTNVFFEVKLKTIKGSPAPANIDVVLTGEKEGKTHVLFIESKFLEYSNKSTFDLSKSYSNPDKWLFNDIDWKKIIDERPTCNGYLEGIKQTITHLFGIHNYLYGKTECKALSEIVDDNTTFEFVNLIYDPSEKFEEYEAYIAYKEMYLKYIDKIKNTENLKVIPGWMSYTDLWKEVKGQYPEDLREYLYNKYIKYTE